MRLLMWTAVSGAGAFLFSSQLPVGVNGGVVLGGALFLGGFAGMLRTFWREGL